VTEAAPTPPSPAKSPLQRFAPLLIILALLGLAFALGLHRQLSLETLRQHRDTLEAFVEANFLAAILIYMGVYLLAVTISLPGALFLSLSGGFLFGTTAGGSATWVSATLGATLVFLAARTAFGDVLRARAQGWIKRLESGFRDNAFNYILALRLFPGAPFFVVNLAPAFLGVKLRDFFLATALGIIPGTFVYAAVGNGLRAAFDAGTAVDPVAAARDIIFSPAIIGPIAGLIALSLLPIIAKAFRRKAPVS
jgi:uncharacterized membrane protein YdjX (TVP38/TMEM64 family)